MSSKKPTPPPEEKPDPNRPVSPPPPPLKEGTSKGGRRNSPTTPRPPIPSGHGSTTDKRIIDSLVHYNGYLENRCKQLEETLDIHPTFHMGQKVWYQKPRERVKATVVSIYQVFGRFDLYSVRDEDGLEHPTGEASLSKRDE